MIGRKKGKGEKVKASNKGWKERKMRKERLGVIKIGRKEGCCTLKEVGRGTSM
jgi:hypothetical protein